MDDKNNKKPPGTQPGADETAAESGAPDDAPESGPADDDEATGWGKGELEELRGENADLKDKLLRLVAEMENLRRRTERDKADTAKYAISNFARDVLTIADNIQRAIDHVPEEAAEKDPALKSFREGIQVTERELLNMMERHGIARLEPKGERFDPNKHQAMLEVPNADVPDGTIVEVMQAGYVIAERVLRPAMVSIAKGGPKSPKPAPEAAEAETAAEQPDRQEAPTAANDDEAGAPEPTAPPPGKGKMGGKVDKSA